MLCALLATAFLAVSDAQAQFEEVWVPDRLHTEQVVNLFASWRGDDDTPDGFFVSLPPDWYLREAQSLASSGDASSLLVSTDPEEEQYVVEGLSESTFTLVFQIETGRMAGTETWSFVPFVENDEGEQMPIEEHRVFQYSLVEDLPEASRHVLSFAESDTVEAKAVTETRPPSPEDSRMLLLREDALPDLSTNTSYTLAFWMQATGLYEVVLSTWDGDEASDYPLELIIDKWGHLRYYRGEPGRHQSMTTQQPIADGQWHHVAIIHDAEDGWTRLLRNGIAVDSLYVRSPDEIGFSTSLSVGARLSDGQDRSQGPRFTGRLAALHVWPEVRSPEHVRSHKRQVPSASDEPAQGDPVYIEFDDPIPDTFVEEAAELPQRVPGTLTFEEPLRDLRADIENDGVHLIWDGDGHSTEVFVVERSSDGVHFEPVGRILAAPVMRDDQDSSTFSFFDENVDDQVVYYRIHQRFRGGQEHHSGTLKLGLGEPQDDQQNTLLGNFPNPFHSDTTIAFELTEQRDVRLSVWDVTGQRVALLLDESSEPGYHEVQFDGRDLPSGTYFVRMEMQEEEEVHQMILTK